jgi:hypothetical protein
VAIRVLYNRLEVTHLESRIAGSISQVVHSTY